MKHHYRIHRMLSEMKRHDTRSAQVAIGTLLIVTLIYAITIA